MKRLASVSVLVIIPLWLGACAGPPNQSGHSTAPINTGLDSLTASRPQVPAAKPAPSTEPPAESALERAAKESAVNLQNVLDQMEKDRLKAAEPTPASLHIGEKPPTPDATQPPPSKPVETAAARPEPPKVEPRPPAPPAEAQLPKPEPEKPLQQRFEETATLLIDLLRQKAAAGGDARAAYVALAAMEALRPGSSQQVITPKVIGADPLTTDDRASIDEIRELMKSLVSAPPTKPLAMVLREMADRAGMDQQVRLGAAYLCTRVLGYGRFTPMKGTRLLQGRPHRAIVYVEVNSFGQRSATEDEANQADVPGVDGRPRFAVDLTESLELYHDADGVKAWSKPEQRILETSVNRRRDFYLVQQVTLPENLTIGAYKLKVIVRDRTTGAQDDAIIPLEIVAEPGLAEGGDR